MTAKRPSLRWYLALARLRAAQLLELPAAERLERFGLLLAAVWVVAFALLWTVDFSPPPEDPNEPVKAVAQIVWQIAILILSAIISYALRPKPKVPEPGKMNVPIVEDGTSIRKIYGAIWIDDSIVLAFKPMGTIPIKAKGGKK
jgi:hypothetical protein